MSRLSATWHHGTSRLSCAAALEVPLLLYSSAAHVRPVAAAFCLLLLPPVSAAASASASDLQQQALYRGEKPAQRARLHHEPQLRDALQTRDGEHDGVLKTQKKENRAKGERKASLGVGRGRPWRAISASGDLITSRDISVTPSARSVNWIPRGLRRAVASEIRSRLGAA